MYRYISLNPNSNQNSLNINRKAPKANPISLLSGKNSFFVKVKSNQIATNYNDKSNKLKNNIHQKNNYTYFAKENKDKSLTKYLNNSQPKVSLLFKENNSIEQIKSKNKNNNSLINRRKQDIHSHNKGIYSFTSPNYNGKINNNSINLISVRKNYNEVLLTDYEYSNANQNKILNNQEKKKGKKIINKDKKDKNIFSYNTYDYLINHTKTLNLKSKLNKKLPAESITQKEKNKIEKKNTIANKNKINNLIKIKKKNQNSINNNNNIIKSKNISNILFNTNLNIDKNKLKNEEKHNIQEGKNRVILDIQKRNYTISNGNNSLINDSYNNTKIFNDNFKKIEEFDGGVSDRKIERKIKSIKINSNNEDIRIKNNIKNNNIKYNFNTTNIDKSSLLPKNNNEKILSSIEDNVIKRNNILNKYPKLDNLIPGNKINLNHVLKNLTGLNSKNNTKKEKSNLTNNSINSIKNIIELNGQKAHNYQNKSNLSDLISFNFENEKINKNKANLLINNNFLNDYFPLTTLNNSVDNNNHKNKLALNDNSFTEKDYHTNINNNIQINKLLNYSLAENNKINKEKNHKVNKKSKIEEHIRSNINDEKEQNNNIKHINKNYNFHTKFISSNELDYNTNKIKTNQNNLNLYFYKENSNNNHISDNYVSKEKNKKRKQNPPLNKIPKKLNILSIIQENNRKIKNYIIRRKPILSSTFSNNKINNNKYKNDNLTIEDILYPDNEEFNNDKEMFDNFDDMNAIVRRINFENVSLKKSNIFTVENKYNDKNSENNIWYEQYSEKFNDLFDKKFANNKQNMSAAQNKIKKANYIYNSKQSGSTKASNVENSSTKKIKASFYIEKKLEIKA